ncbi:DUF790 family protein [Brevifollis gellanilyticus]|uniref:DUF790 family protein n=1 Tax=Brevifollis gellanilyticus TaxID=748831 RepID=UPI0011BEA0DA|nr:DUF790 family protein [Brevifollis gellanilyticus]
MRWMGDPAALRLHGQHVFFPDFVFRHEGGKTVFAETVGYWTPQYLAEKRVTLERFKDRSLLLIVRASATEHFADMSLATATYKTAVKTEPVIEALNGMSLS